MSRIFVPLEIGSRYGKLTVISYEGMVHGYHKYFCQCDCGNVTTAIKNNISGGTTSSCGCIRSHRALTDLRKCITGRKGKPYAHDFQI
jgi:hypothetical protein